MTNPFEKNPWNGFHKLRDFLFTMDYAVFPVKTFIDKKIINREKK